MIFFLRQGFKNCDRNRRSMPNKSVWNEYHWDMGTICTHLRRAGYLGASFFSQVGWKYERILNEELVRQIIKKINIISAKQEEGWKVQIKDGNCWRLMNNKLGSGISRNTFDFRLSIQKHVSSIAHHLSNKKLKLRRKIIKGEQLHFVSIMQIK